MVTPWLEKNPRAAKALKFGREQQFVINPNGIPELCEDLKQCPRHAPTPLHSLPALAGRLGLGEIRVQDESQRLGPAARAAPGAGARPAPGARRAASPPAPSRGWAAFWPSTTSSPARSAMPTISARAS